MKKLAISALASACAVAANSNLAVSGEPDKWYIETSLGFKDYTRSNFRDPEQAYFSERWVDFNYGTDIALSIGYYIRNDLRISAGYKRSKQQSLNFFNGNSVEDNNFIHRIDAYVVSIYKDFPIANNSWTPYVGAGVGIANVSNTSGYKSLGFPASAGSSPYGHITAGLSYSLKKIDLFGEVSYGGIGTSEIGSEDDYQNYEENFRERPQIEKLMNLNGSFGIRYRF